MVGTTFPTCVVQDRSDCSIDTTLLGCDVVKSLMGETVVFKWTVDAFNNRSSNVYALQLTAAQIMSNKCIAL
jgi:hypothetical protein